MQICISLIISFPFYRNVHTHHQVAESRPREYTPRTRSTFMQNWRPRATPRVLLTRINGELRSLSLSVLQKCEFVSRDLLGEPEKGGWWRVVSFTRGFSRDERRDEGIPVFCSWAGEPSAPRGEPPYPRAAKPAASPEPCCWACCTATA